MNGVRVSLIVRLVVLVASLVVLVMTTVLSDLGACAEVNSDVPVVRVLVGGVLSCETHPAHLISILRKFGLRVLTLLEDREWKSDASERSSSWVIPGAAE